MRPTMLPERIETEQSLDPVAEWVSAAVRRALPAGPLKDTLSGTWLGHPLHPMLVTVPIGALAGASLLDLLGGRDSRRAARRLVGLGILSAVPTAAAGLSDWAETRGAARRVGLVHALSNTGALALYGGSLLARRRGREVRGAMLSLAGATVLGVGGYLGGHLTYAYGVGVATARLPVLPGRPDADRE